MRAIAITKPGGPEVLEIVEIETPAPQDGQVLIRVAAAGVNRPDVLQRQGLYPAPPGAPTTPGLEVAGTIEAVGAGVPASRVGEKVTALVAGGGYAEYCLAEAALCLPWPDGFSAVEAASLPETYFTVWWNVFMTAGLAPGDTFLVHGATSGIGVAAVQLAKAFGATVFGTAGSAEKCALARDLGADHAINYREEDFVAVVKAATDGKGVDVVLDMVGGSYIERNLSALARKGRLVFIAFLGGMKAEVNFLPVMLRQLTITGATLRIQPLAVKSLIAQELSAVVWPVLSAGKIRPVIDSTFPLAEAAAAHARMDSGAHAGKIMLTI